MGTWGPGNFQSDKAADFRDDLFEDLVDRINTLLVEEAASLAVDVEGESVVMPAVALILLLCEHTNATPPDEEELALWRDTYLGVFDRQIGDLTGPDFARERRRVIVETFDQLIRRARSKSELSNNEGMEQGGKEAGS